MAIHQGRRPAEREGWQLQVGACRGFREVDQGADTALIYFNDNEPYVSQWVQNLYPEAKVDTRSIADIQPEDLAGYQRAHFFAGIGGWELALQMAGWPDDVPVWTGSAPCQPFSTAGKRKGESDERHLWPEFRRLIAECRPPVIFGEQVASKDGKVWLSRVRADLEALGYGVGAADLCAAGVGAPHIRQRLYWVAYLPERLDAMRGKQNRLRMAESVEVEASQAGVCISRLSAREHLHAPADTRSAEGGNLRPHQPEQTGQQEGEPSSSELLREQSQQGLGNRGSSPERPEQVERLHLEGQEIPLAGKLRHEGRGLEGSAGSGEDANWVAYSPDVRRTGRWSAEESSLQGNRTIGTGEHPQPGVTGQLPGGLEGHSGVDGLAYSERDVSQPGRLTDKPREGTRTQESGSSVEPGRRGDTGPCLACGMEYTKCATAARFGEICLPVEPEQEAGRSGYADAWSDFYLIECADNRTRRVGTGVHPLAYGISGRLGQLRAYGNSIVVPLAAEFIAACMDVLTTQDVTTA